MTALSVCGHLLDGIAGSDSAVSIDAISATVLSLVQRSPNECGVFEFDREASTMRNPWHTRGCRAVKTKYQLINNWAFLSFFASHLFCCAGSSLVWNIIIRGLLEKYPTFGREKETGLLGALDT